MKVLVTGAGAVLGQGIIKSLRQSALGCHVIAADPNPLSAGLYWADAAYRLPFADDPAFGDRIHQLLDRERPDVVLVGTDVELSWFAAERRRLEALFGTHVLVSDPRVVAIADDKLETARFFESVGLPHPASAAAEDEEAVEALIDKAGFPLVVKPRIGARSVGVSVVHDRTALASALEGRGGLVVQQCVGSADCEYTASTLVFDGEVQASIVMRRDLRDGNTYRAYIADYPELNAQVRTLGRALQPHGPANFQFRTDADGTPRVFEINARFSGTTPLRAMAGFNEVEMCVRKLLHATPIVQPPVRPGVILRYWDEMFVPQERIDRVR
ncbi:ATP-grasp domain-containing protein [Sphingobium fuliginis]|jgi:carbamoyl-phosphate synthase large subunit|uniref:ATP-grasp domain-containing protein n=1 Tax=Sphingobium fuliginis (strain ATCC 27551) TaxID=336203 RepID=A0A292Z0Y0_SPHSA|nr:ATP-grasp domain-containing protein [Sphingobium fuliginis]QOT71230.1 ATP-grasp domain-containing protein [Sphingobium fuliginis]GAY20312.1 carbamoyl-phosphate synthase large chain [Sphingobium fuliginis]